MVRSPSANLRLLFVSRMVRLFACGLVAVILVLYLAAVGLDEARIGLVIALTFLGDAAISLWLSTRADSRGRRLTLLVGGALMVLGGGGMALTGNFVLLTVAATIGVISPTGAEVGPFLAVEHACLAQVIDDRKRTSLFAYYHVAGFTMSAIGALVGGVLAEGMQRLGWSVPSSYRLVLWIFAGCGVILAILSRIMDPSVEAPQSQGRARPLDPLHALLGLHASRGLVLRLSGLFAVDSFAGGFVVQSFVAYWFHRKFGVPEGALGAIFLGTTLLSGLSALAAAPLAKRIGLVNTMVWTHLPSNVLLILVPLMPTVGSAIGVLLARHLIAQMDVPTRQSYVNAVVPPHERSAANGVVATARQLGTSLAPPIAGPLLGSVAFVSVPFFLAGGLKLIYDLSLWRAFRHIKPPEEREAAR